MVSPFVSHRRQVTSWRARLCCALIFTAISALAFPLSAQSNAVKPLSSSIPNLSGRVSSDLTGVLPARAGEHLRLLTDLGSIVIHTQNSASVSYHIHLETD